MKKIYLMLIAIFTLSISLQSANMITVNELVYKEMRHHDHKRHHKPGKYIQKEKEREIEYRLDRLEAKYDRDKDRLEHSYLDKHEKKIRKKELKYQYKIEKERLKNEKKRVKKGNFYSY